jgi:DNA-binding transcriptional ArsR family regulator
MASPDFLDTRLAKALSHPLRPRILQVLQLKGEASPQQVATELGERLGNVAYHMRILKEHGCVEMVRTEPRRGAIEHYYRTVVGPYIDDEQWEQLPVALRRQLSGQTLGQAMRGIADAARSGGFDPPGAHVDRMRLRLDEQGWEELSDLLLETLQRVEEIQLAAEARDAGAVPSELAIFHYAPGHPAET